MSISCHINSWCWYMHDSICSLFRAVNVHRLYIACKLDTDTTHTAKLQPLCVWSRDNYVDCWTYTKYEPLSGVPDYTAVMYGLAPYTPSPLSNSILMDVQATTWSGAWCPYCGSMIILQLPSHIIIWGAYSEPERLSWPVRQTPVY